MGGKALKNVPTRRMTTEEFKQVGDRVIEELVNLEIKFGKASEEHQFAPIPSYFSKETHGDIDILCSGCTVSKYIEEWKLIIKGKFFCREYKKNGEVFSFEFRFSEDQKEGFQVDVIELGNADMDRFRFAFHYFSFNDLGNLIGRISHKMGFKFGHDGFKYVFRDLSNASYVLRTINVSEDFPKVLAFLGYDPDRFMQGFETLKDIYEYTASTKYFNPDIYLLENRNYPSRVRDAKRPTYTGFLNWCRENYNEKSVVHAFPEDKKLWLPRTFRWFPSFELDYIGTAAEAEKLAEIKRKFNGKLVREWTGLDGPELGDFMRNIMSRPGFYESLLEKDAEVIEEEVISLYNHKD